MQAGKIINCSKIFEEHCVFRSASLTCVEGIYGKTLVIEDNWYSDKLIETKGEKFLFLTGTVYKFLRKDFFRVQLPNKTINYSYKEYTYKLGFSNPKIATSEDRYEISYIMDKRRKTVLQEIINIYEKQGYYVSPKYISMFMDGKIKRLMMQSRK